MLLSVSGILDELDKVILDSSKEKFFITKNLPFRGDQFINRFVRFFDLESSGSLSDIELKHVFWVNTMVELVRKELLMVFIVGNKNRFVQKLAKE